MDSSAKARSLCWVDQMLVRRQQCEATLASRAPECKSVQYLLYCFYVSP